jgi:hypothetical protein
MNDYIKYRRFCSLYKIEVKEMIGAGFYDFTIIFDHEHTFRGRSEIHDAMFVAINYNGYEKPSDMLFVDAVERGYREVKREQALELLEKMNRKERNIIKRYL